MGQIMSLSSALRLTACPRSQKSAGNCENNQFCNTSNCRRECTDGLRTLYETQSDVQENQVSHADREVW